jgi:uncharacterized protein (TIGR03067 family)
MRTLTLLLAAALALTAHAAPAPLPKPDPSKDDLKKMQGTWDQVSERYGSRESRPVGWQIVVAGDRMSFQHNGKVSTEWRCTLRGAKKPKLLDMKRLVPPDIWMLQAIYSLEGDELTICYDNGGGGRPADLVRLAPTNILYVFKRAKR